MLQNFITDCIAGRTDAAEIANYIDRWHDSESPLSLAEYLGMSVCDYAEYVDNDSALPAIVKRYAGSK